MNFLMLWSNHAAASEQPSAQESQRPAKFAPKPANTLEGLIAEDLFPPTPLAGNNYDEWGAGFDSGYAGVADSDAMINSSSSENHADVTEDQGWITIPYKELPDNWREEPNMLSFHSLDRPFVFPGEQAHILACLSADKQHTEIITPFKVAAVMSKNGIGRSPTKENGNVVQEPDHISRREEIGPDGHNIDQNGNKLLDSQIDPQMNVSAGESLLRMEDHRRQTELLLQRFRNSHFFVRIAESHERLWSKRRESGASAQSSSAVGETFDSADIRKTTQKRYPQHASVDSGGFDARAAGGMARKTVECCSLSNGDIVVLLQVNVGVDFVQDPFLEILQFEKYQERNMTSEDQENIARINKDPCGDLLKWLLPLDNSIPPLSCPVSPPPPSLSSGSSIRSTSTKSNFSGSSGSQIFSFGHFRSYSMSALPPNLAPPQPITGPTSKLNFDSEDWDRFSYKKFGKTEKSGSGELLSFRGVSLEPERFSVRYGLEGIYLPGKRWRRKIEIIQPVEIRSFAADCNTEDLLCVQIKNVCPAHAPDIMVYLDAITIIFEEALQGGLPLSLPIACTEAGGDHNLPNLALRRGEEHSFILKPATSMWRTPMGLGERITLSSHYQSGSASSSFHLPINTDQSILHGDQYAVLVSCRCNYTESRLFFKQPTSWRPRIPMDLLISVASEMSKQTLGSNGGVPQLPIQVLTLQASNLTSEDLTMTVSAPASFMSPPSILSLNSSPTSPPSPFIGPSESSGRMSGSSGSAVQKLTSVSLESDSQIRSGEGGPQSVITNEQAFAISDVLPRDDLGCTHLWLQSRVPLGCVPSRSMATIKLELLPLTDGIITLDSLQIDVKEKGQTYIPECSLKINATSSIATGII